MCLAKLFMNILCLQNRVEIILDIFETVINYCGIFAGMCKYIPKQTTSGSSSRGIEYTDKTILFLRFIT